MQTWSLVSICVLLGVVVRWGVSLNSYSGRKCVELYVNLRQHSQNQAFCATLTLMLFFSVAHLIFYKLLTERCSIITASRSCHRQSVLSMCVCVIPVIRDVVTCSSFHYNQTNSCNIFLQGRGNLPCLATMKLKGTGKR